MKITFKILNQNSKLKSAQRVQLTLLIELALRKLIFYSTILSIFRRKMAPKKVKKKKPTKKQQKALRAEKLKKAEKRKTMVENLAEASPTTFQEEYGILNPEKRRKVSDFEVSLAEESGESAEESDEGETHCPVELAERRLEQEENSESEVEDLETVEELVEETETEVEEETVEERKNREEKWIRNYLKDDILDQLYKMNECEKYTPKPEESEDLGDEVPKCPTCTTTLPRKGKRGFAPKAQPTCQYCYLQLKDAYARYDHYLKHLQTHKLDCPCSGCKKSFGGLASLQQHMLQKHKIKMTDLKNSKNKEDQEMYKKCRKPVRCTEDQPYYSISF